MLTSSNFLIRDTFSDFLVAKRAEIGISQIALSKKIKIPRSTISMIESKNNGATLDSAILILNGLGLGLADYENYLKGVISEKES